MPGQNTLQNELKTAEKISRSFKKALFINTFITILTLVLAFWALNQIKMTTKESWTASLETVRQTTQEAVAIWLRNRQERIQVVASDMRLVSFTEVLMDTIQTGGDTSGLQHELKVLMNEFASRSDGLGKELISPTGVVLATNRGQLGATHQTYSNKFAQFQRVLDGKTEFVLPMPSDIEITEVTPISGLDQAAVMYFMTPVRDLQGKVIAVLANRIDPLGEFSDLLTLGRIGDSGETYIVNRDGMMVSKSRFGEQLVKLNMIEPETTNILSVSASIPEDIEGVYVKGGDDTLAVQSSLRQETSVNVDGYYDYRGILVLGSWSWDVKLGAAFITEIDKDEAMSAFQKSTQTVTTVLAILLVTIAAVTIGVINAHSKTSRILRTHNQNLEKRVKERTAELNTTLTQVEQARLNVERSESRLQTILDHISAIVYLKDSQGRYLLVNKEWENTLGLMGSETIGKTDEQLFSEVVANDFRRGDSEILTSSESLSFEQKAHLKDGQLIDLLTSKIPVQFDENEEVRILGISFDITQRKQLESEAIAARQLAESANVAKSEFLASMSHEIRTPMNGVIGMLSLLSGANLSHEQKEKADIALSSANSLLEILNDILDFSKIESGKMSMEEVDFDMQELVESCLQNFAAKALESNLDLVLDTSEMQFHLVNGDPTRIRQVINNLIGNAIKFTHQGFVKASAALTASDNGKLRFVFSVQDTGIGIDQNKISTLFDSFSQVDSSTTREYGGTGLGLAISRRIIDLLGGEIKVKSKPKIGTTFCFELDLAPALSALKQLPRLKLEQARVLIVDDNPVNIEILKRQLSIWGAQVFTAVNVDQALDMLEQEFPKGPFDLAILDMHMPELDGEGLCAAIRLHPEYDGMKIIIMTSLMEMTDRDRIRELGVHGFFTKPVTASMLRDGIAVVMDMKEQLRHAQTLVTSNSLESYQHQGKTKVSEKRLLVAEDNKVNQLVIKGYLAELGFQFDLVENGQEVLDLLAESEANFYDAVIMDCQMPVLDGFTAAKRIRSGGAGEVKSKLPIVAITAFAMQSDIEKCIASGMNYHVSKPIDKNGLMATLISALDIEMASIQQDSQHHLEGKFIIPAEVQGFVLPNGIKSCDQVVQILEVYKAQYGDLSEQLEQMFRAQDWSLISESVHTLKGASGSCGFTDLYQVCLKVEAEIRAVGLSRATFAELASSLNRSLEAAQQIVSVNNTATDVKNTPLASDEVLVGIKTTLRSGLVLPGDQLRQLHSLSNVKKSKSLSRAVEFIKTFDFDEALEQIEKYESAD